MRPVPDSPPHSPLPSNPTFETISPAVAAALIATGSLTYSHARLLTNGNVAYIFDDPIAVGPELQRRYHAGVFPLVHAKTIADARGFLADEGSRVKRGGGHDHKG
jgi:hypothetical protein